MRYRTPFGTESMAYLRIAVLIAAAFYALIAHAMESHGPAPDEAGGAVREGDIPHAARR